MPGFVTCTELAMVIFALGWRRCALRRCGRTTALPRSGSRNLRRLLSAAERRWLPWFGTTGKLRMRWATYLNRHNLGALEHAFEGIAQTRVRLLNNWANQQWVHLEGFAQSAGLSPINN